MARIQLVFIGLANLSALSSAFQVNAPVVPPIKRHISPNIINSPLERTSSFNYNNPAFANRKTASSILFLQDIENDDMINNQDDAFNGQTTISLVSAQSLLVVVAIVAANIFNVPNYGLGEGFLVDTESIQSGVFATLPLFALAFILDSIEKKVPALQDVSKATQRSVLALLGGARKPLIAIGVSMALGAAAGLGEEMLFRGILQSELTECFGDIAALTSSSVIFGALHAVTPLYAILASLASLYFGELYLQYHNLAVPIVCHGLYDVGALFAAHIQVNSISFVLIYLLEIKSKMMTLIIHICATFSIYQKVTGMSAQERNDLENWIPPGSRME